ncbi:MAG: aspartyl protease family protein [Caulobacteraceae bacterium]|nr:aspartyl protease family protein [Caulobacter sp.]
MRTSNALHAGWRRRAGELLAAVATLLAAPAAHAGCTLGKIAELPVTMTTLEPVVPAGVNGADALFVADSGAFFSMITPAAAAQLHLQLRAAPPNLRLSGVGGVADPSLTTVKRFKLAGAEIPDIDFLVAGGDTGAATVGLIGQNVLGMADVEYDLEHGAIRLMRAHGCGRTNLAYWAGAKPYSVVRLAWLQGPAKFTVVTVKVNGADVRALLDSGANLSSLSLDAARRAGIRTDGPGVEPAGVARGIGRRAVHTWIAPVQSFKIGDEEIKNTHLRISELDFRDADMLLGADFLLSHRVFVANSQNEMFFTYDGGPVFNLEKATYQDASGPPPVVGPQPGPSGQAPETPTDADGFARRAAVYASRREYAAAAADYDKAVALAPDRAELFHRRALVREAMGQPFLAMADLDADLKLQPHDVQAHMMRAELRLRGHDEEGVKTDLDAVAADAAQQADARLRAGELYAAVDAFGPAIDQYDLWIASHADDSRVGEARERRCWARAFANRDLDRAMDDCNAAIHLLSNAPSPHAGRAMVELRKGDAAHALGEFDLALKARPKVAWWLYGRGLAELRLGKEADGRADLAAATAASPRLADQAKALGLSPP